MKPYLVLPTKKGTLDAFSVNCVHEDSLFVLSSNDSPLSTSPFSTDVVKKQIYIVRDVYGVDIDTRFSVGLFSYCYITHSDNSSDEFTVNVYELKKYLGLSMGNNGFDVYRGISDLGRFFGAVKGKGIYPLISNIVTSKNLVSFKSRYFALLILYMKYKSNDSDKRLPFYTSMVRSNIVKCRNHAAVEIVLALVSMIARRGTFAGGKVSISIIRLLRMCPSLSHRLKSIKSNRRNYFLNKTWSKAMQYMKEYTTVYETYSDLGIDAGGMLNSYTPLTTINISIRDSI